ncbi:siderophore-interacting protein [Frondihabitans sp. Leaf304]|uniref:siderophore-interacting protein n=1 Tax=Frondihabitans sp. Leaf304 TaxID=1736329 RepID=UPI0006FD949E|nr:siderophore-interacting protein [Frondihabitans sp. Leaf304]KQQ28474.1 FAD-binding protein [Frondihabitans sp. Leaf304]
MSTPTPTTPRPRDTQHVFVVERSERLSPHLVRIHLGGDAFEAFIAGASPEKIRATDKYVKFLFAQPGSGLEPPYDLEALRERLDPADLPVRRTYTVRSVDEAARTIAVDFVVHGDEGVAGPWAAAAQPGDRVALSGPGGLYFPDEDPATTHVFLGDDSALPAVAAALEALAATVPDARGTALIEVATAADELALTAPAGVEVRWLHRDGDATPGEPLVAATTQFAATTGRVRVFAHGERSAMKAIRRILVDDWALDRSDFSLSAYWALGRAEDRFQAEKREPIGALE